MAGDMPCHLTLPTMAFTGHCKGDLFQNFWAMGEASAPADSQAYKAAVKGQEEVWKRQVLSLNSRTCVINLTITTANLSCTTTAGLPSWRGWCMGKVIFKPQCSKLAGVRVTANVSCKASMKLPHALVETVCFALQP